MPCLDEAIVLNFSERTSRIARIDATSIRNNRLKPLGKNISLRKYNRNVSRGSNNRNVSIVISHNRASLLRTKYCTLDPKRRQLAKQKNGVLMIVYRLFPFADIQPKNALLFGSQFDPLGVPSVFLVVQSKVIVIKYDNYHLYLWILVF
jgi:hypothetical protein